MVRKQQSMDGNQAAAYVSYAYTEVAAIYPITPSTPMAEHTDAWSAKGQKNIFGQEVQLVEMQSEAGAAGALHGSLSAGALSTTYTASQGLLLMIPNIYKIAGEQLPGVFDVASRAVATHALSIFGDHSDIYACRQTGAAMLASSNVQEVMDLTPVAHLAALKGSLPFINFFDGFRTSHEIQKIEVWDYEDLKEMMDMEALEAFRQKALNPNHPESRGSSQTPDIFFQNREASNPYYEKMPAIVQGYMDRINEKIGTDYRLFNYYGAKDATSVIVAMGSVCDTIEETVDYLNQKGEKVGLVKVRLYRPFDAKSMVNALPMTVKCINVLSRTKEPGSLGEPLYLDVLAAVQGTPFEHIKIHSGRYGLGSKDTTPADIVSVFHNRDKSVFTVGILDDVTHLSLDRPEEINVLPEGTVSCKFWGLGSDGTVGANKNSIKIIGDNTELFAQAYFEYDSKKSGGVTVSHLRFGKKPIKAPYMVTKANFVACHNPSYINKFDIVQDLVDGGSFLLNCPWNEKDLEERLPGQVKAYIANHNIQFYTINGTRIGHEIGLGGRINTILQAAFFTITGIIPEEKAISLMKEAAKKAYSKKGDAIVQMNYAGIDAGAKQFVKVNVPEHWKDAEYEEFKTYELKGTRDAKTVDYVEKIQKVVNAQKGNLLPVSTFLEHADGSAPAGTSQFEKRGIAVNMPIWQPDKCIQCNRCAFVCPHGVIRPFALTKEEAEKGPKGMEVVDLNGVPEMKFMIAVSALDCTGCSSCANVCPGKNGEKALVMESMPENEGRQAFFDYARELPIKDNVLEKVKESTVRGSQFKQPLLEFSGACAGCGETPYAKLITQLFGDRMYIANATGCSSIWGHSAPSTPYTKNAKGQGPAWSNSLFEDNAEFGYGMYLAQSATRKRLASKVQSVLSTQSDVAIQEAGKAYLETFHDGASNGKATTDLISALEKLNNKNEDVQEILRGKDSLSKKSQWIFGGDGWAYDIGFGGLDHVIASGEDVNIFVFDTEVYSNTGGQSSKATNIGATAKFAAAGKSVNKKDLAAIAMSYGNVYVAQISMGADFNQTLKAIREAESYPGPSLIIAYAPCIEHGIKNGMGKSQTEEKLAVECGYWINFRYNPSVQGKKLVIDSKEPDMDKFHDYLMGEVRYASLKKSNPERAEKLFEENKRYALHQYRRLKKLVEVYDETDF